MFTKILVPLDQSSLSEQALGPAIALARASGAEIDLVLAHEIGTFDGYRDVSTSDAKNPEQHVYLAAMIREVAALSSVTVRGAVKTGAPVDVICDRAREVGADLIVMTSHGRTGVRRAWLGSVADGVSHAAPLPVLILRSNSDIGWRTQSLTLFGRILVLFDGSTESAPVLEHAAAMARCTGATLILGHVVAPVSIPVYEVFVPSYPVAVVDPEATREIADRAKNDLIRIANRLTSEGAGEVETMVVVADSTGPAILELTERANPDLIAMTSHGRGATRLVISSLADRVLRGTDRPLLLFPPQGTAAAPRPVGRQAMTLLT
jgi:nucleotide-binding universal stress UspA family protein